MGFFHLSLVRCQSINLMHFSGERRSRLLERKIAKMIFNENRSWTFCFNELEENFARNELRCLEEKLNVGEEEANQSSQR